MNPSQIYIVVVIAVLAVIAVFVILENRHREARGISPLAALGFAFVLAGLLFGSNRLVGYALMGVGVLLAASDMANRSKHV